MQRFALSTRTFLRPCTRSLHLTRPSFTPSKAPESDLTHPALLRDPPAETPTDPWSLTPPPPPPSPTGPTPTLKELLASPHPEGRDNEPIDILRKRLVYESRKRGILEMDLILATFAKSRLAELDEGQLREYDRFLTLPIGPSSTMLPARLLHRNPGRVVGFSTSCSAMLRIGAGRLGGCPIWRRGSRCGGCYSGAGLDGMKVPRLESRRQRARKERGTAARRCFFAWCSVEGLAVALSSSCS
ncbi:hypothetical protein BCR35DRAFT_349183 [Leucosporidium creatinivorum]|uniref:Uncharacterized protein n=1 Tax=Leucosporidium creatinivorum TaxID=106004 RepID=A0A1Y2G733_9BASI|nr:hypothetical protein BCR35DRAFT_349183 [Leucosporidium creatinivorum]